MNIVIIGLEILAWILAYKQNMELCILLVVLANILEWNKERRDNQKLEEKIKKLEEKME